MKEVKMETPQEFYHRKASEMEEQERYALALGHEVTARHCRNEASTYRAAAIKANSLMFNDGSA